MRISAYTLSKTQGEPAMENQSIKLPESASGVPVQYEVSEDGIRCESVSEYTLPDYSPEIRKLLRVQTKLIPTRKYISPGKAEFSGNILYTMLYSGEDGGIFAAGFTGDYEFSCQLPQDVGNEPSTFASAVVESCSCRLVGPRRMSVRTRLRCKLGCTAHTTLSSENSPSSQNCEEKLRRSVPVSDTVRIGAEEFSVSENITIDGHDTSSLFPIVCDGNVRVGECSCESGRICVKGEIWTKCLISEDSGKPPMTITRKIPFEEEIYADNIDASYDCRIDGNCHSVDIRASENEQGMPGVEITAVYSLEAQARKNRELEITEDMYSCLYESNCDYENIDLTRSLCLGNKNLSLSSSIALPDGISPNADISDVGGEVKINSVTSDKEGCRIEGECNATVICTDIGLDTTPVPTPVQARIPFKCVIPSKHCDSIEWDCRGDILDAKARIDEKNLVIDAEIALAYSMLESEKVKCVSKFNCDTSRPLAKRPGRIRICHPQKGEKLWDIGKRFGVSSKKISEFNNLKQSGENESLPNFLLIR
jgi:hypothetical protein